MSDQDSEQQQHTKEEVKIEDLPVDEATAEEIKGGPGTVDNEVGSGSNDM